MTIFYSTNNHDSVEYIPTEYDTIVKRSQELVKQLVGHDTKEVLVLQTADNIIHEAIVGAPYDADEKLLNAIGKNNTVVRLICCCLDGSFDLPSYDFRKKLCELNPHNEAAQMLLNGEKTFILKSIRDTFPKHQRYFP